MNPIGRRTFLGTSLAGLGALVSASLLWPLLRYLAPLSGNEKSAKVVILEKDVPEGDAKFFEFAGSSALLVHAGGGRLLAFSAVCTHLGCIVQWEKDKQEFICPCHAGHYNLDGDVTGGPPPKPLARLPISVLNGTITVG